MTDSPTGFDRAPDRYTGQGRETIDRMRDLAHTLFGSGGDRVFAFFCLASAMKYGDRAGRKGSADEDRAKARWYVGMARHVLGRGPDPRSERPGFVPWTPREFSLGELADLWGGTP